MRGKGYDFTIKQQLLRITPAYAGKRIFERACAGGRRDHPRVCGEKNFMVLLPPDVRGSPPRMRGKGKQMALISIKDGITPAYAGKSIPATV